MKAIGQPISRIDGRLKVTGGAHYTSDIPIEGTVHGVIVQSTIANGRTTSIDTAQAEHSPGVLALYPSNPRMSPTPKPGSHLHPHGQSYLPLQATGFRTPTSRSRWLWARRAIRQHMPAH